MSTHEMHNGKYKEIIEKPPQVFPDEVILDLEEHGRQLRQPKVEPKPEPKPADDKPKPKRKYTRRKKTTTKKEAGDSPALRQEKSTAKDKPQKDSPSGDEKDDKK